MAGTLGTITGQVRIDVAQAVAAYAALRAANIATLLALRSASAVFIAAGAAMGAAGLAIGAGFIYAVKAAAEFERKLDFFGAVSNATAQEMEQVRQKALDLGEATKFSSNEIADSFVELGKAGVSARDIIDGVGDAVANLGAAGDIPLAKAATIITAAIQTFKLGAEDATRVADLLAGAANASIVDIDDLGVSLKYVGGVAASISLPIEDTIDAISLLGKAGIRGSTAGTSLRQILVSLTGTSLKAQKVLKNLGIITADGANKFFDAQGKAKPLAEIFQILQDHTEGLTEAQRLSAFKTIFNNRALAAAAILSREGAAGFAAMRAEISKTTAADVAAKRLDNLSGDVERLKSSLEVLAIEAGGPFQEFLRDIVQGLTGLVNAFNDLDRDTQKTIFQITAIAGAVLLVMGAISTALGIVFKFAANLLLLKGAIMTVIRVLAALRIAMIATWLAALGPVGLIIAAVLLVIGVIVLLWLKCEGFRNVVKAVGAAIVAAFWAVVHFFQGLPAFFSAMWAAVVAYFNIAKAAVIAGWNAVINFFVILGTTIKNAVVTAFNAVVGFFAALPGRILGFVSMLVNGIVNFFIMLPERIAYALGFLIGLATRLFLQLMNALFNIAKAIVMGVTNFLLALPGRLTAIWRSIASTATSVWNTVKNAVVNAARATFNGVVSFFSQLPGRIASFFQNTYNRAIASWNSFKASSIRIAAQIANGIVQFLQSLPGKITQLFNRASAAAVKALTDMKNKAVSIAKSIPGAISSALSSLGGLVKGAFERAINAVSSLGGAAYNKAKSIGSSLWNGFKDGLGISSPSFIERAMFAIHDTMVDEIGFLGKMVGQAQRIGGDLPTVQRTITGVQQARNASIDATSGTIVGSARTREEGNNLVHLDDESIAAIVEALTEKEIPVYLDGKKVDAAMTSTAIAGGYATRRDL